LQTIPRFQWFNSVYHPKKKPPNKIFWTIAVGILVVHLIGLAVFGGIVLFAPGQPDGDPFEEPPRAETIDPVQIEFKRTLQEKQQKSQRPKQKLQVRTVNNLAMPDLDIQVPNLSGNANIGRVGGGFGDLGGSALGVGDISISLFDIKAKGEKFIFAVDVRSELLADAKGGIPTYDVIKEDILGVIDELPSGVLFNVILFDRARLEAWRPTLQPATESNKKSVAEWFEPVNKDANSTGIRRPNMNPSSWQDPLIAEHFRVRSSGGAFYFPMVTAAILEQEADGIYVLTDAIPDLGGAAYWTTDTPPSPQEINEARLEWVEDQGFDSLAEYFAMRRQVDLERNKRINQIMEKANAAREKAGKPPRIHTPGERRKLTRQTEAQVAKDIDNYAPNMPGDLGRGERERVSIDEREIKGLFERLLRANYDQKGNSRPLVNVIVFKGEDEEVSREEEDFIDEYVDFFDGDYRVLKGLGKIDSDQFR